MYFIPVFNDPAVEFEHVFAYWFKYIYYLYETVAFTILETSMNLPLPTK